MMPFFRRFRRKVRMDWMGQNRGAGLIIAELSYANNAMPGRNNITTDKCR
jgi:hypothetical protein